jgi:hypothetical protein
MPLPDDNDAKGAKLRPYVWLIDRTGGIPNVPTQITVTGTTYEIHDGNPELITIAGLQALVYRTTDRRRMFVLVKVANVSASGHTAMVVIGWFPVAQTGARAFWDAAEGNITALLAAWGCTLDTDGKTWLASGLDAASGIAATAAKSVWPSSWRVLLPTDPQPSGMPSGSPTLSTGPGVASIGVAQPAPAGPPTGPLLIGATLAS